MIGLLAGAAAPTPAARTAGTSGANGHRAETIATLLGYAADSKLLIVHADDFGEWHGVNTATTAALESGAVTSASLMVPCAWFPEAAHYAREHADADIGLHVTLTSERTRSRWGPVLSGRRPSTLVDAAGYFLKAPSDLVPRLDVRDAEDEARAQIARARALGVRPTHLDSHQGALYSTRELFTAFMKVSGAYRIPMMASRSNGHGAEWLGDETALPPHVVVVDRISIRPDVRAADWKGYYDRAIARMRPGLTQLVVHLAHATDEVRAATSDRTTWDAAWRQRDFDYVTSAGFRALLRDHGVTLVTWREIGRALGFTGATAPQSPGGLQ